MKGSTPLVHILHGYDFAGNRLYRNDVLSPNSSELYICDQINQVKSLDRGVLNQNNDIVTTSTFTEAWDFDKTGNWMQYDKNGTVENRTYNAANELQGIATHDTNGNMILMPGLKGKYDAWNRLVEVRDSSNNLIARYDYNGMNQRIKKIIGSNVTKSFFNKQWQEMESVTDSDLTTYVWELRYIDDLVLREKGAERLYSLADPNWNVVAIIDATGTVQERMKYDAFGKITWLDDTFVTKANSNFAWNRTFTGQVLDGETGLILCRSRYFYPLFGRLSGRDPIAYQANDLNLYRYVFNNSLMYADPFGLDSKHHWFPQKPETRKKIEKMCPGIAADKFEDFTTKLSGPANMAGFDHHTITHVLKYDKRVNEILDNPNMDCCKFANKMIELINNVWAELANINGGGIPELVTLPYTGGNPTSLPDFRDKACDDPCRDPKLEPLRSTNCFAFSSRVRWPPSSCRKRPASGRNRPPQTRTGDQRRPHRSS